MADSNLEPHWGVTLPTLMGSLMMALLAIKMESHGVIISIFVMAFIITACYMGAYVMQQLDRGEGL